MVDREQLVVELIDSRASLTWQFEPTEPNVTDVYIKQCSSDGDCVEHMTNISERRLDLIYSDGDKYSLVIYLDGLLAYTSEEFIHDTTTTPVG